MGLLGTLFSKIFPSSHAANRQAAGTQPQAAQQTTPQTQTGSSPSGHQGAATAPGSQAQVVDIEQVLNDMASKNSQKLNWRTSIVDLMKLVGMDSSLEARKELAKELNYTGDTSDSAAMNIWLHKQVMKKMADNGGKVPQDLLH
jgi:hypothetical protein